MQRNDGASSRWIVILLFSAVAWIGCNKAADNESSPAAASTNAKLPITTKSEDARKEFLAGQDLSDRLLGQESLQHFDNAIALDPDFAYAELVRAQNSPTAEEFFDHLKRAVGAADKASEGEKLLILSVEAGTNGDVAKQKADNDQLLAAYPNDERVQTAAGVFYFGQQDFAQAIEHLKKATDLAPAFSPAYNMLGYSYRQNGDYANAEQAFKKYIELIPNDPNPHDSYAELLLKMGRFDDSVAEYRKALSIDPNFNPSRFGLSADLTYMGKPSEAETELQTMAQKSRNDGELRTALFAMAVVESDGGHFAKALQEMDKEYAVAEKKNDVAAMSADLQAMGNILEEVPDFDKAKQKFDRSLELIETSSLSQQIKDIATLQHHHNMAAIAIGRKDYKTAKSEADEYRKGADASNNPVQVRLSHELAGRISLAQKDYDTAITELQQANPQDPRNLFRLGQACEGKGDSAKAQDYYQRAAAFNSLPQLNYAFVRVKAEKIAQSKKG